MVGGGWGIGLGSVETWVQSLQQTIFFCIFRLSFTVV